MLEKLISSINSSILDSMKKIQLNAMGVVFIADEESKLCGIITDGDIRRAILNGTELDEKVSTILHDEYTFAYEDETYEEIMKKVNQQVRIIPIVNKEHQIIDFFKFKSDVFFPVSIPELNGNEFKYLIDSFISTWISSSGKYINQFENDFAKYCNMDYGVCVSNGSVALHLALTVLDIGEGDEVIIPDLTFAATINAVLHANATPVIVDIESDSWCIDPDEIRKAITPKTKAIIPVHLYGQPCNMDEIMKIAKEYNLYIIEDCAEAHGARYDGKLVGSFGDISCFSFFGNKIITTGEGGMCLTNNPALDEKMRIYRDHGMSKTKRYWHDVVGFNYRMTNIQAAIGCAQLEKINLFISNREYYENFYKIVFKNKFFEFQRNNLPKREKITWLVSVLAKNEQERDKYLKNFKEKGLDTRPFFYSLGIMDIYKKYLFSNKNSLEISKRGLNLPTYANINKIKEIEKILKNII